MKGILRAILFVFWDSNSCNRLLGGGGGGPRHNEKWGYHHCYLSFFLKLIIGNVNFMFK